jgi:ribonuclease T2
MAADQQYLSTIAGKSPPNVACRRALAVASAILLAVLQLAIGPARASEQGTFDYYALSLSWSPTYCAGQAGGHDNQQCAPGRRFAFVVHGLWPQFEKGWPQDCDTSERWVPEDTIQAMLDIMPSRQLVIHEWKKHGSCSGLNIADYFAEIRTVFGKVRIPARYLAPNTDLSVTPKQLSDDFVKTNGGLDASMMAVECGNRTDRARVSELRLCFDRDGAFRACGENEKRQCRAETLMLPKVR